MPGANGLFGKRIVLLLMAAAVLFLLAASAAPVSAQGAANAHFSIDTNNPYEGEELTFDASHSSGSGTLTYTWDFGDGAKGTGEVVTHTFGSYGTYVITLLVEDGSGDSDFMTKSIYVSSDPTAGLWFMSIFMGGFCLIYGLILLFFFLVWLANIIILIVLYKKMKGIAEEMGAQEEAKTYTIIQLIIGLIGIVMFNFIVFTIIGQFIVYILFKSKMDSIKNMKKMYGGRPPPGYPGQYPPPHQPPRKRAAPKKNKKTK